MSDGTGKKSIPKQVDPFVKGSISQATGLNGGEPVKISGTSSSMDTNLESFT